MAGAGSHRDTGGALVEDGELGAVVEEARHAQALLLAQAELAAPVYDGVQAALPLYQVFQIHRPQQRAQLTLRNHIPLADCSHTMCK